MKLRSKAPSGRPTAWDPGERRRDHVNGRRTDGRALAEGRTHRARLVEAAKRVFERDGFLEARIVDIAEAANIAPGTFYHYFESKEELFREVAALQEARLIAIPSTRCCPTSRRWRRSGPRSASTCSATATKPRSMGVIEQMSRDDEHVAAARMSTLQHFFEQAEHNIGVLQQRGLVDRRIDADFAAAALGAMAARFAELWLVQGYGDFTFDDAVEQLSVLCANALGLG